MNTQVNSFYEPSDETMGIEDVDAEDVNTERSAGALDVSSVDEDEGIETAGKSSKKGDDDIEKVDPDVAEAESLTVACKSNIRRKLEDELAEFLAKGGRIQEVPSDDQHAMAHR